MENWTWENVLTIRAMTPLLIGYVVFFWGVPMLGSTNHNNLPKETLKPYWTAVWQISGLFHGAAIIAGILVWLAHPYMVIS
jgi:hypothetical protein